MSSNFRKQQRKLEKRAAAPTRRMTPRRRVFSDVRASVVAIAKAPPQQAGAVPDFSRITIIGTGFVVDRRGLVLTAAHVVRPWIDSALKQAPLADAPHVFINYGTRDNNGNFEAGYLFGPIEQIHMSQNFDLAVVRLRPDQRLSQLLRPLPFVDEPCGEGDEVGICGYPFGLQLHAPLFNGAPIIAPSFSQGIVSAVLPHPDAPPAALKGFQLDAMVNGGNSGGPIFDAQTGRVIGVVTSAVQATHKNVRIAGPKSNQPSAGASSADPTIDVQVPTGLAIGEHIHHTKQILDDARSDLTKAEQSA